MADFDVIVVGSGMSGGWVAKEMCERGFKVCVIERGRQITPEKDYTDFVDPWDTPNLNRTTEEDKTKYPIQSTVYAFNQNTKQYWVEDEKHPYETAPGTEYGWLRGYHTGGRSMMWGRQSYRMSEIDFQANKKDGHGVDWPVRYNDIKPWYDKVDYFAGISGSMEGLDILPDGVFQPAHELSCAETEFKQKVETAFPTRKVIPGRVANLTQPTPEQTALGRGQCQARDLCYRGCSFGAYFNSNVATLPAAKNTGNLTMMTDTAVVKVDYDEATGRATGVKIIDINTKQTKTVTARVVFLNASTIATSLILLNSASDAAPKGLGNSSRQLGKNLMDHVAGATADAIMPGLEDKYHWGRRPNGFYIPRFRNHTEPSEDSVRGYGYQGRIYRDNWRRNVWSPGIGAEYKNAQRTPGPWRLGIVAFCEILPDERNHVAAHATKTDEWGLPIPVINQRHRENEVALMRHATRDTKLMLEAAGMQINWVGNPDEVSADNMSAPGRGIHEMGTARMGRDPKTSVLNQWNQSWDVPNLFITDGSFMTSGGCQNPSISYMAFSARAAHHAADLMESGVL
ncbi:GMC oxidoreductase [Robiginitomaculum antarcticum]|uniref:GMC oxidoreductase n=1 Tax=Robiginitomaculum antarcticum TaxID=437507 RepID=UPI00039BB8EC|nr:GMC family oxidoreductase [Robiginitomaculum antarcticum]